MKKKIFVITSIILIIGVLCSAFVGCKSADEKEKEYYDSNAKAVETATETLSSLTDEVFSKAWTSSFVLAMTYYKTETNKVYDKKTGKEAEHISTVGSIFESPIKRGSEDEAGWPVKEAGRNDEEKYTIKNSTDQYVYFMAFDIDFKSMKDYTVKTTVFKEVERSYYINNISKKNFREKFEVEENGELEYTVKDGVASGQLNMFLNPIELIKASTDKESIRKTGVSASDNFRIYTNFMRIESRSVIGLTTEGVKIPVNRELNDASDKKYWTNYGEDITYNWDNVYGMTNNRLTVLYSKGKKKINSLEIYNEDVLAYYTKKDKVNTYLVLKADVVAFTEMVVEFKYAK